MSRDLTGILSYLEFDEVKPFFAVELLFETGTSIGQVLWWGPSMNKPA